MFVKVIVMGAGCSAHCGYPLAHEVPAKLASLRERLASSSPRIAAMAETTLRAFAGFASANNPVQTVDDLAWRIFQKRHVAQRDLHVLETSKHAMAALFLADEAAALGRLNGYRGLFKRMFGSPQYYQTALKESPWRILSFNYDRLFELAFVDHFHLGTDALYGPTQLNSGFNLDYPSLQPIDLRRFSFLKLHGSVGALCDRIGDELRLTWNTPDPKAPPNVSDEVFFRDMIDAFNPALQRTRLLVFPHERQALQDRRRAYIDAVWTAAQHFITEADEIRIAGYSVPDADWDAFERLLGHARCKTVIVQDPFRADETCERLRMHFRARLSHVTFEPYRVGFERG